MPRPSPLRRRSPAALLLAPLLGACFDLAGPGPTPDPDPWVLSARGVRIFGETRIPVLLVQFLNSPTPPWSPAEVKERYVGGSNGGLLNGPYRVASEGRFRIRLDVSPWIAASVLSTGANEAFIISAIATADQVMDFGKYDNDGPDLIPNSGDDDGKVDGGVVILHASPDLSCSAGGSTANSGPHPHARTNWRVGDPLDFYKTLDPSPSGAPIKIDGYTIMSVHACSGVHTNAPVVAHELGHLMFGIPDLYHQLGGIPVPSNELWRGRRWVVGCWELMAAGSWGCGGGPPMRPPDVTATFGAWTRQFVGWGTQVFASAVMDTTYELSAVGRGGTVLRIPIKDGEYLLVEYREGGSGDNGIPGAGVLIHHIDEGLPLRPLNNTDPKRYRVQLVEADDDSALVNLDADGGNRGMLGDAFGRTVTTFSPATHSAAFATDGSPLPFRLEEISFDIATRKANVRVVRDPPI